MSCMNNPVLIIIALITIICIFVAAKNEKFTIFPRFNRYAAPYYTTTFQAYPGKYMHFGSGRNYECLQRNNTYSGYKNCMLFLE